MSHKKKKQDTFEELVKEFGDCPEKLFNLAKTEYEKAVAVEFFLLYKKIDEKFAKIEEAVTWCKWLVMGIFGVTAFSVIAVNFQVILRFLGVG